MLIELAQPISCCGLFEIDDVIHDALETAVGVLLVLGLRRGAENVKAVEYNGGLKNLPIGNEQAGRKINHYFSRRSSMILSVEACHGEKAGKRNVFYRAG